MSPWIYQPAADLSQSLPQRLRRFPREPDMLCYSIRSTSALLVRGWLRAYHRFRVIGQENLPREGSFVMVANHASHLDALCLLSALPLARLHRAFPAAAADYFFVSGARLAAAVLLVNALPFDRKAGAGHSLLLCRELLQTRENILILFPEGTRSGTGEIGDFRPGIGMLLAGTQIPVVPCFLDGAADALPRGAIVPRPHSISLTIGEPRTYADLSPGRESSLRIAQELRQRVMQLGAAPGQSIPGGMGKRQPAPSEAEGLAHVEMHTHGQAVACPCHPKAPPMLPL